MNRDKYTEALYLVLRWGLTVFRIFILYHFRQLFTMIGGVIIFDLTSEDVIYSYLPLYHSSGAQLSTAGAFFAGSKTIIKKKFSVSSFWKDIVKYDVTVMTLIISWRGNIHITHNIYIANYNHIGFTMQSCLFSGDSIHR